MERRETFYLQSIYQVLHLSRFWESPEEETTSFLQQPRKSDTHTVKRTSFKIHTHPVINRPDREKESRELTEMTSLCQQGSLIIIMSITLNMLGCFNPTLGQIWTNPNIGLKM